MTPEKSKLLLFALTPILVIVAVRLFIAQPISDPSSGQARMSDEEIAARAWLKAVRDGDQVRAIQFATALVPEGHDQIVNPAYVGLAKSENVYEIFLKDKFNRFDFQAWRDAVFFFDLAAGLKSDDPVKEAFDLVVAEIEPVSKEDAKRQAPWPRQILERKHGLCDRMCWVLAEILYQNGYETQIVYLMKKGTKESPHTILEVRKGKDVWLADPLSKKLLPGMSVEKLVGDDEGLNRLWPSKPIWRNALPNSMLYTPSYPQDYCWRNQELYRVLVLNVRGSLPRFGGDPLTRQRASLALRKAELGKDLKCNMMVWHYPFRVLLEDIKQGE